MVRCSSVDRGAVPGWGKGGSVNRQEHRRVDLLGECNTGALPIDVITSEWCARCSNPECTRSLAGKLSFDQRTSTWLERLFTNVPRANPLDPKVQKIAAQKFLEISPGRIPEIRSSAPTGWMDPRDLAQEGRAVTIAAPPPMRPPQPPASEATSQPPLSEQQRAAAPKGLPRHLVMANAPPQSGRIVSSPTSSPPPPTVPKDPWSGPAAQGPKPENLVNPGATVKLGGSGV